MDKKELNLGEQLITVFAGDIRSGKFDDCIVELPADNLGSITKYKYQFQYEGHILDGVIAVYERSFEYNEWFVQHDILKSYRMSNEVAKKLFYAMHDANLRNIDKANKANEKKIAEYLNARNNPVAGSCNGTSAVTWINPIVEGSDGTITIYGHAIR